LSKIDLKKKDDTIRIDTEGIYGTLTNVENIKIKENYLTNLKKYITRGLK